MQRSTVHHHGMAAGLLLALFVAVAGFLLQTDLARLFHRGGTALLLGVFAVLIAVLLAVRIRSR